MSPPPNSRRLPWKEVETMADARGSASYKKELVRVFVARAVRKALGLGDAQGRAA